MWRKRISTGTRWGATLASVVIGVVWPLSLWWDASWTRFDQAGVIGVVVWNGSAGVFWGPVFPPTREIAQELSGGYFRSVPRPLAGQHYWLPAWAIVAKAHSINLPLYLPLLLTLAPAAFLWRREIRRRRARVGVCSGCGYDRAGLAVGVKCPECGRG